MQIDRRISVKKAELLDSDRRDFMLSWADKLIHEYTGGRQELKKRADQIDRNNPIGMNDLKQINSMIESMTFSLEWMTTGKQPGTYRGVDEKAVYQKQVV